VTEPLGTYWTTTRSLFGTPRLLGPSRCGASNRFLMRRSSRSTGLSTVVVVAGTVVVVGSIGAVVGLVGLVGLVGAIVGTVGGAVVGEVGGVDGGGGATVTTVGASAVDVVAAGRVVDTVVDVGRVVVVVDVPSEVTVDGGCVGTATLFPLSSLPPSATNATRPIAHNAITAPAVMRAAVTSWVPLRVPCDRRIESAARAESTSATIVPRIGRTMLTTAHTIAATANGSTRGLPPHPPGPSPLPDAPVGSGSGPTGTAPVSSGPHSGGPEAGIGQHYRWRDARSGHCARARRVGRLHCMPAIDVLPVTGDPDADQLLVTDPFALLVGMLLDQQVPMEWAFRGPSTLRQRLGTLDANAIAAMSADQVEDAFRQKPALHRYPGSMAKRTHALATHVAQQYNGDAAAIWLGVTDPAELLDRIRSLPGFGDEKAKIFVAILGKRLHVAPEGWEHVAAPFGDANPRSVADIDSPEALQRVRAWKQEQKKKGKTKSDA